jgi:hypothetical protein
MAKEIEDIISEDDYGYIHWNENKRNEGFLGLPNKTHYKNSEKFKTDLQYKINNFLEEIGYDDKNDDIQFYSGLDNSEMEFIEENEPCIKRNNYFKK